MLSRSAPSAVLIGASLFLLCAFAKYASGATISTDAQPSKHANPTRVLARILSPGTAFPPSSYGASLTYNSTPLDLGPSNGASRLVTDTLPSAADVAIELAAPIQVIPGATTAYTLTVHNLGPDPATGIVLANVLSKGIVPVWIQPPQPVCERQGRAVSCSVGNLRPNDAAAVALDLSVGGTQALTTSTQLAGVTLDLSEPNCIIDAAQFSVTCRLNKLRSGASTQIRVGASVDARATGTLTNTAIVTANEADLNPSNNRTESTMTVSAAAPVIVTPIPTITDLVMRADGPSIVIAGQPFTYTYTITNRGERDATGVHFEDALPPTANLYAYSPGLPDCRQRGDVLACSVREPDSGETVTFTLAITGNAGQPVRISLDQPMPGWPICTVLKERTWLHIVNCELGTLGRGQSTHVQLGLVAIGVQERLMTNAASVSAHEADLNTSDNTITATMAVQVRADLSIRSAVSGALVAGKPFSYTLTVANNGPSDADNVVLTDTLPMSTRLVSADPSQGGDCRLEQMNATTNAAVCRLGALGGGKTATVVVVLGVDDALTPALAKTITHFASVLSDQVDPNSSNNELRESIPIGAGAEN